MGICNGISTKWLFIHCFQIELVSIFVEGGKPENPEKNPRSRDENQQQTQSIYDAGSGNRTRDTAGTALTTVPYCSLLQKLSTSLNKHKLKAHLLWRRRNCLPQDLT